MAIEDYEIIILSLRSITKVMDICLSYLIQTFCFATHALQLAKGWSDVIVVM